MRVTIEPSQPGGSIKAIASKSQAHRMLICAAFADRPTDIVCRELSQDIEATAECLRAMGSGISYDEEKGLFRVVPVNCEPDRKSGSAGEGLRNRTQIDVGESGSTLRFLLPVVCALAIDTHIVMHGRLPQRPLSPLWEELERHGAVLSRNADGSVDTSGALKGTEFSVAADVSSQFISGLLFALPIMARKYDIIEEMSIRLTGKTESENYILMTIDALKHFGVDIRREADRLIMRAGSRYSSPGTAEVEGDWSNGAFWLCAAAMSRRELIVSGLDASSAQGDRAVTELIRQIIAADSEKTVIDAGNVPDLVPVLSVLAASVKKETVFIHAERLRIKESDRIKSTVELIRGLGGDAGETEDGLRVNGSGRLKGGTVDSCNDHRIAMSAAVASIICEEAVTVTNAQAVRKSYPVFWKDLESLGVRVDISDPSV